MSEESYTTKTYSAVPQGSEEAGNRPHVGVPPTADDYHEFQDDATTTTTNNSPGQHESGHWAIPVLTLFALLADYLTLTAVIPIVPLIFRERIPNPAIFLLFSSKSLVQILANPVIGHQVDRKNGCLSPPGIFLSSLTVLIMATFGFAYGVDLDPEEVDVWRQYYTLLGCRAIQGLASSGILSAGMATISLTTAQVKE